MFLIAVTQNQIQERFHNVKCNVSQTEIESLLATIVTDGFLSQYSTGATGFSIIESPLINTPEVKDVILAEIIFDKKENRLSVFKPTKSGRPIYYHINSRGEFYCSTHISMLKKAGVVVEENTDVLPEFFVYGYVTPPKTLYKNINQLSIGSNLCIALINGQSAIELEHKYDPFSVKSSQEFISIEKNIKQIHGNLSHSINLLSPCSSRLSVLLSGGLDSSIIFAICRDIFAISKSYSTSYPFEDAPNDREKKYAISAAKALKSDHYFYEADNNEYLYGFLESISIAEEPLHHLQSVMFNLLFKKGLPYDRDIVISGQGSDGVFGLRMHNYMYHWNNHKAFRLLSKQPLFSLVKIVSKITGRGQGFVNSIGKISNSVDKQLEDPSNIIFSLGNYGSEEWVCDYFSVGNKDIVENRYQAVKSFRHNSIYDILSMLDLIGDVSVTQSIWSKLAEGNNKILYYPFTDRELLNTAFSIRWETKLKKPKNILRSVARDLHIPKFIIERPKSGFGISPSKWATKGGIFDPLVPLASKCFDKNVFMNVQSIEPKRAMTFWNILNYSIWKRLCIDNESLDILSEELSRSISDRKSYSF